MSTRPEGGFNRIAHFKWEIAICYHPMYMLVDEDRGEPPVGERVPPWGTATAEEYLERVKRNLASLEENPELTLNYEWAVHSLVDLADRFPDVHNRMKAACERGQLCFVGGEYSLAHTHTYSSEAAWRQFQYGMQLFRELYGRDITVHAHQEVHVFRQLPQLLQRFGFEFLVFPAFPWGLTITSGTFDLYGYEQAYHLKKGDDFITVQALDGTAIPGFFTTNVRLTTPAIQVGRDLWSAPPVLIDFPDLEEYHNPWEGKAKPVLLDKAAANRLKAAPPRATGQVYSYYSYCEGLWAEAHQRASKRAEDYAIQAGNLLAMSRLKDRSPELQEKLDALWKTILKYQDHDATWTEMSDLRQKAINRFLQCTESAAELMATAGKAMLTPDDGRITAFNGLPRARTVLMEWTSGERLPETAPGCQKVGDHIVGLIELPSLGCASYEIATNTPAESTPAPLPSRIETDHYRVTLSGEGLIQSIRTASGETVLQAGAYLGGEIRGVIGSQWQDNRNASVTFSEGSVCACLERAGRIGTISTRERYLFLKSQPLIKCQVEFEFNDDRVGDFHIEESKLNIYQPTRGERFYGDTQFAVEEFRGEEQIIAQNWVYGGGLVYVNRGTPKHWIRDGVIANTVAYGGDDWTNRIHPVHWAKYNKTFPQPLNGRQVIEYWLIPFGAYDPAGIVAAVEDATAPIVMLSGRADFSVGTIDEPNLVVTALHEEEGEVMVRGYQLPGDVPARFPAWRIFNMPARELLNRESGARPPLPDFYDGERGK